MGSQRRLGFGGCWVKATIPSPSPLRNWISSALDHDKPRVGRRSSRTINHCARARELCPRRGRYGGGEAFHTGADAALAVVFQGKEEVAWDEGGYSPVTNAFDKIFLQEKVTTTVELTPTILYDAGEAEYRFSFQLPSSLPSSFDLRDIYSGAAERLRVQVKYRASVWLRADSESVAYLNAEQEFTVHAPPTITPPVQALEISASEVIHWLCCINRGSLQLTVEIQKDVYAAGEVVALQCRVDESACKASVKAISVDLVEEVVLRNLGEQPDWTVTRVLSSLRVDGPGSGRNSEKELDIALVEGEKEAPINPDVSTRFFRCMHRLIVRCKPVLAQNIVVEVPVRVLHHNSVFNAGAVRVLRMPAEATSGNKSP